MGDIADQHSQPSYLKEGYWEKKNRKTKQKKSRDKIIKELKEENQLLTAKVDKAEEYFKEIQKVLRFDNWGIPIGRKRNVAFCLTKIKEGIAELEK